MCVTPRHQTEIVSMAHPGAAARIAYTRAMSERASMLPEKETKYSYNAFQARDGRDKSECDSAVYSSLHGTQGSHFVLFRLFNTKNAPKYQNFYLATPMEHDSPVIFAGALAMFAGAPPPVGPTLVTGPG